MLPVVGFLTIGCSDHSAKETSRTIEAQTVESRDRPYTGPKYRLVVGEFQNRAPYMTGVFSDPDDREHLRVQALNILMTHLAQSGRFTLMDRENLANLEREAEFSGTKQTITGGDAVLTGAVTEFGRRETGRHGALSRSRTQTAYAKVTVSIVDVKTSQVQYSCQGAGEFSLTAQGQMGFGGFGSTMSYDSTLADKVLNLAAIEAVNRLVEGLEQGKWVAVAE
ncbi:MAG: hypothetical protein IPM64_03180 [Phycisphaerales bacterium]|nr:hypothetical protein [Phycisphaerales bacterium]